MKALFLACDRIGDGGKTPMNAFRPWFSDDPRLYGYICEDVAESFAVNLFAKDQSFLDVIAADPRTEFAFPIDVAGSDLDYSDEIEVHPSMQGKIIAWCAQTYGAEFGQWIATNAKNRRFVAQEIMSKVAGILDVDPLNGFRVFWE